MKVWIRNLVVLLVVQLVLLAFLQFSGESKERATTALLELEASAVTRLAVSDVDGNEVSIKQADGGWVLASGLPATDSKVTTLLEKLAGLNLSWPVATSSATHDRFEVAEKKYQRRVVLNDGAATLWFGTSPGYQQVHARRGTDDVYAVKLATYEMPATADDWLDKSLLHAGGEVRSVRWANGMTLENTPPGPGAEPVWLLGGVLASAEAAQSAVQRLASLDVLGVLDTAPSAAPSDAKEILLRDSDGEYRLSYWPRESNGDHVIMSTRFPGEAFRMSNYVAEQLEPSAAELLPTPAES